MDRNYKRELVENLFNALDNPGTVQGVKNYLGGMAITGNPQDYGATFAFARDLHEPISVPFEARRYGRLPLVNRVAIIKETKTDSQGKESTVYSFHATRKNRIN